MKILIVAMVIGTLGFLPVHAYDELVQPQLDTLEAMYSSMDQTATEISEGKSPSETESFRQAEVLSASRQISNE